MSHLSEVKRHLAAAYVFRNHARRNLYKPTLKNLETALSDLDQVSYRILESRVALQQEIAERRRKEYLSSKKEVKP